ncbi:zf-PARP-domain-containing protein [Penicillium frequentans]|uniref:Zf-PARP-domain-containing protein n=1 Tax=Penicillium frequentans TaxID=3151616 RepID=A0AAD6CJA7_9EURO|nr:zf-PARP-domain-containing protein [Penicillium glabrum]
MMNDLLILGLIAHFKANDKVERNCHLRKCLSDNRKIPANSLACTKPPVIKKLRAQLGPTDKDRDYLSLDGWKDLPEEDQARVREALENVDSDVKKNRSRNRTPKKAVPGLYRSV